MAALGTIEAQLNALPLELRGPLRRIFTEILTQLRFGHPKGSQPDPCTNFGAGFFHATTPGVAGTEFSITHGFGRTPYLAFPVARLDAVGSAIVPLTVSRAADDNRVYFTSTVASAPVSIYVEG